MRKLLFLVVALAAFTFTNAQTENGSIYLEVNTAFGAGSPSSTGFSYTSVDGESTYNFGAEAGYFIMDDLALKAGLGFGGDSAADSNTFSYKIGAEYFLAGKFPLQVNYNAASIKDLDENPSYLGLQGAYAWFINDSVSLRPGIAYNMSLNSDFYEDVLQFNIGFAVHL